ncbi:response regulator transcription factor [Quadrisphaera oryzae]|uniref:response regulator transcription factor n=1 Tax=Quadrisphaera TaxID=317661 RepID=UPI0016485CA4|nr:response regulator transcription factor [Quadrisphaera sp. RL12-1S]MBC3761314.1 response regulator transcription factor [Quadrisphaera sp. RL12-1S]
MRILVVEDDAAMARLLRRALASEGYAVDLAGTGPDGLWAATENDYDVVVLDAMIPAPNGFEVARQLRERSRWAPILMLTARADVADRVRGLDSGADDYLTKPFALDELFARVRALVRRGAVPRPAVMRVGDLELDPGSRRVERDGTPVELTSKEFALLAELMRHPGQVLSRSHLIDHVWDSAYDGASNVVEVHVRRLREKVDRPFGRESIRTSRGAGYLVVDDAADADSAGDATAAGSDGSAR